MVKCPFCQFDNEDGALFCEQCKSDLGAVQPLEAVIAQPIEQVPIAAVVEEAAAYPPSPGIAEPIPMEAIPVAEPAPPPQPSTPVAPAETVGLATDTMPAPVAPQAEPMPLNAVTPVAAPSPLQSAVAVTPAAAAPAPATAAAPTAGAAEAGALPAGAQPRLVVLRGLKINVEYPLYEGHNFIGRADEKPVDIDLDDQEPPDRIWSSRQHALITYEEGKLSIEDLSSSNGTFVNRTRIYPGQKRPLNPNDVIQIGTVQMKVKV